MKPTALRILLNGIGVTAIPDAIVGDVVIDSRKVKPGDLFIAIAGDNFDGNDFAAAALRAGAVAAVVSRCTEGAGEQILVSDTRAALRGIAGNYRSQFSFRSVGVTGSVGKTTTKEMTSVMLSRFGRTLKTIGNLNNQIGLPMTMFRLDDDTQYAAIEMGMTDFGEVGNLSRVLRPDVGIVTRIGISHIEYLKTQENILKAKLEIADGMPPDGIMVLNAADSLLMANRSLVTHRVVTFAGEEGIEADVMTRGIRQGLESTEFTIVDREAGSFRAVVPTIGLHNVADAVAAYTAVTRLGLDPQRAVDGLPDYVPAGMRQRIVDFNGVTVVEDCYNAAPESMKASLGILAQLPCAGLRVAVLGNMNELGDEAEKQHRIVGIEAARDGIDVLLCRGRDTGAMAEAARASGVTRVECFETNEEIADYLKKLLGRGDCVLFKASRTMKFEEIIEMLYKG